MGKKKARRNQPHRQVELVANTGDQGNICNLRSYSFVLKFGWVYERDYEPHDLPNEEPKG